MNKGFFAAEEIKSNHRSTKHMSCHTCGLFRKCKSPKMPLTGEGKKGIFILAEAPEELEDKRNKQLVGTAGQLLRKELNKININLDEDCWKMDAINCRPMDKEGNNRTPIKEEIETCRPRVWEEIKKKKPKLIILLGGVALDSFLKHRWPEALGGIEKWRGWTIPDREAGCWVVPTFHPNYVNRSDNYDPVSKVIFKQDLKIAKDILREPFPEYKNEKRLIKILDEEQAIFELKKIYRLRHFLGKSILFAFDYETTGLKPHADGHYIYCISFSVRPSGAYVFEPGEESCKWFARILESPDIRKTAHNIKFEDSWTYFRLYNNTQIQNWYYDTMLGAHTFDNRKGITGLKFQGYVNFGIEDWSSKITPYLKSTLGGNGFNRIHEAPKRETFIYGGMDSLIQFRLAEKHLRMLG